MLLVVLNTLVVAVFQARTVEKCMDGHHKVFPSSEIGSDFEACFPWKSRSCCTAQTTKDLKENEMMGLNHIDWEYCGKLSKVRKGKREEARKEARKIGSKEESKEGSKEDKKQGRKQGR